MDFTEEKKQSVIRADDFDVYFRVSNYQRKLFKKVETMITRIKLLPLAD
jgi:hypothetical protein